MKIDISRHFRKNVRVSYFIKIFPVETFLILRRIRQDIITNVHNSSR